MRPKRQPDAMRSGGWPNYARASDLAGGVFPVSEAVLLREARKHGIGRKIGRTVIFSEADCQQLYEVLPCQSNSSAAPNPRNWIIRGTLRGIRIEESTGTDNRRAAEEIRAKREAEILAQSIYGRRATATFAEAALSYLENGGSRRFMEPVLEHFGTTPLARIDLDAIERGARKVYPGRSNATLDRQFYTPVSAVLKHAAKRGLCSPVIIERPEGCKAADPLADASTRPTA